MPGVRRVSWLVLLLFMALLVLPAMPAAAQTYITELNPSGGTNTTDGLRVSFKPTGRVDIKRNNLNQVWFSSLQYVLYMDDGNGPICVTYLGFLCTFTLSPAVQKYWTTTAATAVDDQQAQVVYTYDYSGVGTVTVTADWHYVSPNSYVNVRVRVDMPDGYDGPLQLYAIGDVMPDGADYGPGVLEYWQGRRVVAQYASTGIGGIREAGTPWDSYAEAYFDCVYGYAYSCPDPALGWSEPNRGIGHGEPYPNTVDPNPGTTYETGTDAGVGAHWDLSEDYSRAVTMQWYFSSYDDFVAGNTEELNPDEMSPWPEDYPPPAEPTPEPQATPVPDCTTLPDMAVSPELISLAEGTTAQIEVALRNLCADRVFRGADLLVSLSDGITVRDGSAGMLNLGGRAAWQNLSLNPGETRRFLLEVAAPGAVPPAPQHISELYYAGTVARRIDGVFISAAPVSEPAATPVVETPTVEVPAPPSLPVTLPNTGGVLPLLWLPALAAGLATAGVVVRRKRR